MFFTDLGKSGGVGEVVDPFCTSVKMVSRTGERGRERERDQRKRVGRRAGR